MFCPDCNIYRDKKDFILNQTSCYKCVYKKKTQRVLKKLKKCKICDILIDNPKKFSYCSEECAEIGNLKIRHERWAQ
jgi:predicted nucleic acid-binding Zn ribbon protein